MPNYSIGFKRIEFMEYISPDGETFRFDDTARFLISETGFGMPGIDYISQQGPFQHGNTIYDYRLKPRVIQLLMRENSCSRQGYWDARQNLVNMLRPNRQFLNEFELGVLRKIIPDGTKYDIAVMIEQGPEFAARDPKRWDEFAYTETLRFIAPDPTFYNPDINQVVWTPESLSHLLLPFTLNLGVDGDLLFEDESLTAYFDINYPGTWLSFPVITITGPISNPVIANQTTGESIDLTGYTAVVGEIITVDLSYGQKTVTSSVNGNIISYVLSASDLATFHIACHPEATNGYNQITIQGDNIISGSTQIQIGYYTRWIGI